MSASGNDFSFSRERHFIQKFLAGIVFFVPFFMASFFIYCILSDGSPEFRVDKTQTGLKVSKIQGTATDIQKGDLIVDINGLNYDQILSYTILPGKIIEKQSVNITVNRAGRLISFSPELKPVSLLQLLSVAWPHFFLILCLIGLGIISFLRVPASQPGFVFLFAACMFATTITGTLPSYFGILSPQCISLSFFTLLFFNWLAFGAFLHFVFSFPNQRNFIKSNKWLIPVFYTAAPLTSLFCVLFFGDGDGAFWGWLQRFRNIALPFMITAAFIKHLIDYNKVSFTLEKNQIKIIISAYWLSFGPYLFLYAIPNILFNNPLISFRLVVISGILLPAAYFVSLVRYKLLKADRLIARTVSYFLLTGLLIISYSYIVVYFKRTFLGHRIFSEEFFLVYIIAVAVLFEPLSRMISSFLDQFFLPKALYHYSMIPALTRKIGSTIQLKKLIDYLTLSIPSKVNVEKLSLLVLEKDEVKFYPDADAFKNRIDTDLLLNRMAETEFAFCNSPNLDPTLEMTMKTLGSMEFELLFPLRGGTGLAGFLLLGNRKDGKQYSERDIRFFTTLCNQTGLALENCLHYDSLKKSKQQIETMFSKVVQSEKMAALGEMSTMLAHELKNPMGIIRSSAQYIAKNLDNRKNQEELLDFIISEVDGLESVINNIMGLAKHKPPDLKPIDLLKLVSRMTERWIQSGNHNKKVSIIFDCPEPLPEIKADFKQLQQVFLNCITNAEDAMPEGGSIHISIRPGGKNSLAVQIVDSGPGIPEEHMKNAFKKFFTTKEKGIGIGLPLCKQIIAAHNGRISIQNNEDKGLTVDIRLPADPLEDLPASGKTQTGSGEHHRDRKNFNH